MKCEQIQSQVSLYLYGELPPNQTESVEEHAEACASCAEIIEDERRFFATMNARASAEVSHSLLAECRHDLMRQVYRAEPVTRWGRLSAWFSAGGSGLPWQQAGLVAASVAVAFLVGRATSSSDPNQFVRRAPEFQGTNISFQPETADTGIESVAHDPQSDRVEIVVEEISRRTITGRRNDPEIHRLLLSTIRSAPNSGVRLDSLDVLTGHVENQEVRRTLLGSMLGDRNPGVRLKALDALRPHMADPEVRNALVEVLRRDENSGMRVSAIDMLTRQPDRDLVGVLQELVETEANDYVRLQSRRTLQDLNASVDRF
jgi:hypothetical protein